MNLDGTPPTTVLGSTFFTTTPSGYSPQSILKIFFIVFFALKFEMYRFCKLFPILKSLNMAEVGHSPVDVFKINTFAHPKISCSSLFESLPIQLSPVDTVRSARCFFSCIIASMRSSKVFCVMKRCTCTFLC